MKKLFFIALFLAGLATIAGITFSIYKETKKKKEVQAVITELQDEAERLDKENSGLMEKIAYLGSDDYKKREAKDKLNLQDKGEEVVIIKPNTVRDSKDQKEEGERSDSQVVSDQAEQPNPEKWWDYFFEY